MVRLGSTQRGLCHPVQALAGQILKLHQCSWVGWGGVHTGMKRASQAQKDRERERPRQGPSSVHRAASWDQMSQGRCQMRPWEATWKAHSLSRAMRRFSWAPVSAPWPLSLPPAHLSSDLRSAGLCPTQLRIVQYCSICYGKTSVCKWTCVIQTHVVQRSAVYMNEQSGQNVER